MKLLLVTQKVDLDDDVLGFMHSWIAEFSKNCEKITVVCLQLGKQSLPDNVKILSLGKEKNQLLSFLNKLKYILNFYKYIWQERNNYDTVFVHMNTEYILLGGLFWKLLKKKTALWYAHGEVSKKLIAASFLVDYIFTSTKSGCRIKSEKIKIVGQGIDTDKFKPALVSKKNESNIFNIITVGRISPVKDYNTLIEAIIKIKKERPNQKIKVSIVGGPGLEKQKDYFNFLKEKVNKNNLEKNIYFIGPVANEKIVNYLQTANLFANMSFTGSLDKAILEAMSCGLPVLTCNEALDDILAKYKNQLLYGKKNSDELATKIENLMDLKQDESDILGSELRDIVIRDHSLNNLIKKIIRNY